MMAMRPCRKCHSTGHLRVGATDGRSSAGRSVEAECTGCRTSVRIGYAPTGPFADGRRPGDAQSVREAVERRNGHRGGCGAVSTMGEGTCAACADRDGGVRTADGPIAGGDGTACGYRRARRIGGGRADMGVKCPNCGGRTDRVDKGDVFVCGKGRPPMREAGYHCRRCDSTVIFLGKCEPEGVGDDR